MKQLSSFLFIFASLWMAFKPVAAPASELSEHQKVANTAEHWLQQKLSSPDDDGNIEITVSPVDERIRLPGCPVPYEARANGNSLSQSTITVKVHCPKSDWFIYVMARVRQMQPVVITTTPLSPGTRLSEHHLQVVRMDKNQLRGTTFESPEYLIGAKVKRRIRSGDAIVPRKLCFVCEGDRVTIMAKTGGLSIKTSGIAEQDGNIGDTIQVRNRRSERLVNARVLSSAAVRVGI